MKKSLIPLTMSLVCLLVLVILTGCGTGSTPSTTSVTSSSTTTTPTSQTSAAPTSGTSVAPTSKTSIAPTQAATTTTIAAGAKYGGTLRVIQDVDPSMGNIGFPPKQVSSSTGHYWWDGLLRDEFDGTMAPALATSWDIDTAAQSVTFHLRKGVKFSDGTDFNAQAVKWMYDLDIAAKKVALWKSVDLIDDYTVKVNLNKWTNVVLRTFESNVIVSPTAYQKNGEEWMRKNPVGTGPFKLVKYVQDTSLIMERNPDYWEKGKPYLDRIEVTYIPDPTTRKLAMQTGVGDITWVELGKEAAEFMAFGNVEVRCPPQAISNIVFDDLNADSPYYDKRVREAVEYAIDKEWLAKNLGYGLQQAPYQLVPRGYLCYDPNATGRKYDTEKAKALLAEAGYPNGFKTELIPSANGLNRDVWVKVQSDLSKVGIQADLKFLEISKFNEYRNFSTWKNAIIAETMPGWPNTNVGIDMMYAPAVSFFKSMDKNRPDWVAAYEASVASAKVDPELVKKACRVLYNDNASVIPIYECGRGYAYYPYVKGTDFTSRASYFAYWERQDVWIDK
jgi:ABC-type transport system substrate-binding protein